MKLLLVGCSHHSANVETRELLAFNPEQAAKALDRWHERFPKTEAVLLSTCNRVELYSAADAAIESPSADQVKQFLTEFHNVPLTNVNENLFELSGKAALKHLFTVAASLDSMVLGEPQILAQVKSAYGTAQEHNCTGSLMHGIFQSALHTAKRVATETSINEKRVSIPSIAVGDFAREIYDHFGDKRILVIGAGEMADETVVYLKAAGARNITLINRSAERASELALKHSGVAANWDALDSQLIEADLIISTTGASEPIVTLERYAAIEAQRYQRPLVVLDLAIPRDFEPAIGERLNVYLYSIDDLQAACDRNRQLRDKELPVAMKVIEEETTQFMTDVNHRHARPVIQSLRSGWKAIREQELARLFNKVPSLDSATRAEIEQSFERFVNKVLHPPLESLRDESKHGTPHGLLDALKRLFRLDE